MIFAESVTVLRAGPKKKDKYGNETGGWDNPVKTPLSRVAMIPVSQQEQTIGKERVLVTTGWRLHTRPGVDADITALDRIEWRGQILQVMGEVARFPAPLGSRAHHIEADVRKISG